MFWTAIVMAGLVLAVGVCVYLVAADRGRFMAQFTMRGWDFQLYQATISNFLEAIHAEGMAAWPKRLDPVAVRIFRHQVRKATGTGIWMRSGFMYHHLNLAVLLKELKPFIDDQILAHKMRRVVSQILIMRDTADRDRLGVFLDHAADTRRAFAARMSRVDQDVAAHLRGIDFLTLLRTLHAMFEEHGYCLLPELEELVRWEQMEGTELVQELPRLTVPKTLSNWVGLVDADAIPQLG